MVKTDSKQNKAFTALLKKALSAYKGDAEPDAMDPIAQLVISFLLWNTTQKQAELAYDKILAQVVDLNELRVSHPHEIVAMIGVRYPNADARVRRMLESMMEVFAREHDFRMTSVKSKGKREQREYLDSLPAIPPFVAARVALLSFGAHAMPVDDKLADQLINHGIFEPGTSPAEIESWMIRQFKAGTALEAHLALQAWSDQTGSTKRSSSTKKKTSKKTTKKKTAKKKTTKKRVAKKK
ncbi:MAG: hypothetical protein AAGC44_03530 [Planctomycetota bacterium]